LKGLGIASEDAEPAGNDEVVPSLIEVLAGSLQIMQVRIARSRLAGEPADVMLAPRLGHLRTMDYHRGREAIAEGHAEVERMLPAIRHALEY
jgi:NTE family protein